MEAFLETITSFPTIIFTFFLGVAALYWLFAAFGFIELDALDVDLPDLDGQMSLNSHHDHSFGEMFAGLLLRLGLNGVPVTIVISLIALLGWLLSYYPSYLIGLLIGNGLLHYVVGLPIFIFAVYIAVILTASIIKPLRVLFAKADQQTVKKVLGQVALVRSSKVDNRSGEATLDDGGAGFILKVRSIGDTIFQRGDRVVLLEYLSGAHVYHVISEQEFLGNSKA